MKKLAITLSQTALAVTLLMGNITPPADQNFYEDDAGFNQVSVDMESGWGWGFNKAQAQGNTGCFDTTEWEPMPCAGDDSSSQDSSSSQESSSEDTLTSVNNENPVNLFAANSQTEIQSLTINGLEVKGLEYASIAAFKQNRFNIV